MALHRHLWLPILAALSLSACASRPTASTEQRNARPMLRTAPASLLRGERSAPPADDSGAAYVTAYGSAKAALERANIKLASWATLWKCVASALATGSTLDRCDDPTQAIAAQGSVRR